MKTNEELVAAFQQGDPEALDELWRQNERGVAYVADKIAAAGLGDPEDLKHEGFFGLLRAAELFDPAEGTVFITYAWPWIRQAMYKSVQNSGDVIRLPSHVHEKIFKYRRFISEYSKSVGCDPTDREICAALRIGEKTLTNIREALKAVNPASLEGPAGDQTDELTLGDMLPSEGSLEDDVARRMDREKMSQDLAALIDRMSQEKQWALRARYWEERLLTPDEMQKNKQALAELRQPSNKSRLRPYYEQYLGDPYKSGLQRFRHTGESVTEHLALRRLEMEERHAQAPLDDEGKE